MAKLLVLKKPDEIRNAYDRFEAVLPFDREVNLYVGTQGGGERCAVKIDNKRKYWFCFFPNWRQKGNDLSVLLGDGIPSAGSSEVPTVQLNTYRQDPQKRMSGRYMVDESGLLYVGHSGKAKSGRKTVDILKFSSRWQDYCAEVRWVDKPAERNVLILGRLDDPLLADRLALFVHEMASAKSGLTPPTNHPLPADWTSYVSEGNDKPTSSRAADTRQGTESKQTSVSRFEFAGESTYLRQEKEVHVDRFHGTVTNALMQELHDLGLNAQRDEPRDIFIISSTGEAEILFEVKSGDDTQSVYTAIGQLMFHGAAQSKPPRRVIVLPKVPTVRTEDVLKKLGIKVLTFEVGEENRITFKGLNKVLP